MNVKESPAHSRRDLNIILSWPVSKTGKIKLL